MQTLPTIALTLAPAVLGSSGAPAQEGESLRGSWFLRRQPGTTRVLTGANVIDVRDGSVRFDVDLHVAGDRIAALGEEEIPGEAEVVANRWAEVDDDAALELADTFRENGTGRVPTPVVIEGMGARDHDGGAAPDETVRPGLEEAIARAAKLAVAMHRRGGPVGTGADFPVDGVEPGVSRHRELQILVGEGGATPLEALRMAVWDSVRILGVEEISGVVEPGRIEDLVVLAENPLDDHRNAAAIELVVHAGWWHEP